MANLFAKFIYSLTAGHSSVVSHVQNLLGAQTVQEAGITMGNGITAANNFINLVFWEIEKFILGIISALEYIAYEFLGIGQGVDNYADFAKKNSLTSTYTRTFKAVAVVAIILMIIFTIFAIIKQEWNAAQANGGLNPKNNNKTPIVMRLLRGIVTIIALPVTVIIIFGTVNSVLTSFNRALQGRDKSTIATNILATASFNSNRYRLYVEQDRRVPIVIQAYRTSDYKADEKEELTYKIKSLEVQNKLKSTALNLADNTFNSFKDSLTFSNNKLTNSSKFGDYYESFVCTPEQYQVMAEFIDYAELTQENFYIRAVDDDLIDWKYVSNTVYDEKEKSLTITYSDASKLTTNNNGLNTTSAASTASTVSNPNYTITYSLGYDISSPISDAYKTMQALLGIGDYSDILYNKMEREEDSVNVVHWASKKVSIHFSKNFVRDNPQTWTPTDEILMYEYYHFAYNNTFQDYSLDDLSYEKAVIEEKPVTLDAKIYTYRKYYAIADAYGPEIDVDCVYINGNYYITELSETESDKFGNPYYVLKNIEDTNFLTHTYTTVYEAKDPYKAVIKLTDMFDINDPMTWTYSDQIIMYEYYKDLSYNNEWSKYKISNFNEGVTLPVYVISLHSSIDDIEGSSQFYALINGVYYELRKVTGNDTFELFQPETYYNFFNNSTNAIETVEIKEYNANKSTYETGYKFLGVNTDKSKQFMSEINSESGAKTFYNYSTKLNASEYDTFGISTEGTGTTANNFLIIENITEDESGNKSSTYEGGYNNYYYITELMQDEGIVHREFTLVDRDGKPIEDDENPGEYKHVERDVAIVFENTTLKSGALSDALEFDNFEEYGDFDLRFSSTFDYKDVNTWNYRDYFIFYLYSKYLSVSGMTLNQLKSAGGLRGEVCRVGISVNDEFNTKATELYTYQDPENDPADQYQFSDADIDNYMISEILTTDLATYLDNPKKKIIKNIYDYDEYGNSIQTDAVGNNVKDDSYQNIITDYVYLFRIDSNLTSDGNETNRVVYIKIEDVLNISQMNILNPLDVETTFNTNNFDKAYESSLFVDIDNNDEREFEFSYAETSYRQFAFSSNLIYDSQNTWTVGDFILFYLYENEIISIDGVNGSLTDMEDTLKDYRLNALSYSFTDESGNTSLYYKFGAGSSALYLNTNYVIKNLGYSSIENWWNTKLFDYISKVLNKDSGNSSGSVIVDNETLIDGKYHEYTSSIYNKENLVKSLVEEYIFDIDNMSNIVQNTVKYKYYNSDFVTDKIETWTVLDGIINSITGKVTKKNYEFETAFSSSNNLCLLIDDTHALKLTDEDCTSLGLSITSNYQIVAKSSSYENVDSNYSQTFGLVKTNSTSGNIVSYKNLSTFSRESISQFSYSFASSTTLSQLDCLLIELYNTKDDNGNFIYRGLSIVDKIGHISNGQKINFDIYVQPNSTNDNYYLYLGSKEENIEGNVENYAYFYVFDTHASGSYIYNLNEEYKIECNKNIFTKTNTLLNYPNFDQDDSAVIGPNDKFTLLDAIIFDKRGSLSETTYSIYQTNESNVADRKSYINVNNTFIEVNSLTETSYNVGNISIAGFNNESLIKLVYDNYYFNYYTNSSDINSSFSEKDIYLFETYEDREGNPCKNEIVDFNLADMSTWTPLNVILYNLGLISSTGERAENVKELSKIYEKNGIKYLRIFKAEQSFDISINSITFEQVLEKNDSPVNTFMFSKAFTIEVFLKALYYGNSVVNTNSEEPTGENRWLTFDSAIDDYIGKVKSYESLGLYNTYTPVMEFNDLATWNWYEMLHFYFNNGLPSGQISYLRYGEYNNSNVYIKVSRLGDSVSYIKFKISNTMDLFNTSTDKLFVSHTDDTIKASFNDKCETDTESGITYYKFGYDLQNNEASVFGIINYKLSQRNEGKAHAYEFYKNNEIVYYLDSIGETYIRNLTNSNISVGVNKNIKYTGVPIINKTTSQLNVFDLYIKSIGGTVTADNNTIIEFGGEKYLLINNQYISLSKLNIEVSGNTLVFPLDTLISSKLGITNGGSNSTFVNSANAPTLNPIASNLPTLPGMESGSTIIKLNFSAGFDFGNYSTWKLSDFLLYYIFVENSFNYNNNKEEIVTNFQKFVTQGYVESTFCNLKITDENSNVSSYNVLLIGQAIDVDEFGILNASIEDVSKYILVDYSIFYELFAKNLMNIYTFGFTNSTAPLSIESIGKAVDDYDEVSIRKFGVSFASSNATQDFKYNNNYYFELNSSIIDEYFNNAGISQIPNYTTTMSGVSVLINLKFSWNFDINDPKSWTVLDYIIVYEFSRNVGGNAFDGITFEDLKEGILYEIERVDDSGDIKYILNINGNKYNLSHWYVENGENILEVNDNLYVNLLNNIDIISYTDWNDRLRNLSINENEYREDTFNVRFSSSFDENDVSTWTIFDCIIYYEFLNNKSAFNNKTLESLKSEDWDYPLIKGKVDTGRKYEEESSNYHKGDPIYNYTLSIKFGDHIYNMEEICYKYGSNEALIGVDYNIKIIDKIDISNPNNGYDIKVLSEARRYNINYDVRDVVSELENTLVAGTGASIKYYKLRNLDTNEEIYVNTNDYSEKKYSPDDFEVLDDNYSINNNISRSTFVDEFSNASGSSDGSSHKRVELIKAATTLEYYSVKNTINWTSVQSPKILNDYYKLENQSNGEIIFVHMGNISTLYESLGGGKYKKKDDTSGIIYQLYNDPVTGTTNSEPSSRPQAMAPIQSNARLTYYRNLDKNVSFNYQISLTRYKNYTISANILKVNWPQKLISDLMVIYPDIDKESESGINWATLLATDGWIETLGDYHSGTSSGQYIVSGNSANINTIGLVLSEFLLSIAEKPTGYATYANYEYQSIYDSSTIKALMLSILGEEEYDALVNEANIFVDFFNVGFAGILDDIAKARGIEIKEGKVDGFEMSIYKSYLSTAILSSDFAEYLYTVATRVLAQYTIYEPLARSANDYDTYYAYYNNMTDADGELVNKFTYGTFKELVMYENQSLRYGVVPIFTFNVEYVRDKYQEELLKGYSDLPEWLLTLVTALSDIFNGRDAWGKMLDWYESYYSNIYLTQNSKVSQDDPMYCFMFDVYYSIKQSIKYTNVDDPVYLKLYKAYLDGDKNSTLTSTLKRWDIIKDVSIDGSSAFLPNYAKYQMMLQVYKVKAMVSYLDFLIMPLYTPLDAIQDAIDTAADVAEAYAESYQALLELGIDLAVDGVGMAADVEAMKWDVMFNQDDLGDRAQDIGDRAVGMYNNVKETANEIYENFAEMANKIAERALDAAAAITSVTASLTCYRAFKDNAIYSSYFEDIINPLKSLIFPYLKSEGQLYDIDIIPLIGPVYYPSGQAGVVAGWNQINTLHDELGYLMEAFETLYSTSQGTSSGYAYRYYGLRDNVIDKVYEKLSTWYNDVGSYINMQSILDRVAKGSITFTLAQYTNNYKEEGYHFTIQNRNYKMKTAVSTQRIGEYVYGGEFLEHFGIPATYTSSTFNGLVDIGSAYDNETHMAKKTITSFGTLTRFASGLANYTGKLYLLSNVMDLSATNNDNPVDPSINNTDSVKMTDYIYAENKLLGKLYDPSGGKGYIRTTQEYLILDYMIQYNYLSYDTLRSLLVIDDKDHLPNQIEDVLTDGNFDSLTSIEQEACLNRLRFYLAYVQSDGYDGNYNTNNSTTSKERIHTIFKKTILYLTNMVEDNSNGYETMYQGETLSFDNMYFQKLKLILINALVNFEKNDTDTGEANANRYLSLYNLSNSEIDYYYNVNTSEKYATIAKISDEGTTREKLAGRTILVLNNTLTTTNKGGDEELQVVEYIEDGVKYSTRASFRVDTTSDGLFKKLAGIEHRPVEELVNREYNQVYARNGSYDEEFGDTFILCYYDPVNCRYYPYLAEGIGCVQTDELAHWKENGEVKTIDSDFVRGHDPVPIIAKGIIIDGISGYMPTAIKMVNNEVFFYRDAITATGDLNDAVASGVVITEVSTSKYIKYVGTSSFSGYGDAQTMYIGANNPVAYIESNASVYYIQYTTNYTINTEDEFGSVSVLQQFPNFYTFDMLFHLLMLLGFVVMIPVVFKAILLGMRRMLDLMALILVAPLAIATNSLQTDGKGNNKIYDEWKRMFTASLLTVFGIVVSFNIYYILVNTTLHMTFITAGDATMTIIADSPLSFITVGFLNNIIKFFFVIIAANLVESGGKLIGKIITGNRVANSYASQISGTEPLEDMKKIGADVKKSAGFAKKLYSGELLEEAFNAAVEAAKESIPGSAVIRKAMDASKGKQEAKKAQSMADEAKKNGVSAADANELARKYLKNANDIRKAKRDRSIKMANAFISDTGMPLPVGAQAGDFDSKGSAKAAAKMDKAMKKEEAIIKNTEKKNAKMQKKLKQAEDARAKGKETLWSKRQAKKNAKLQRKADKKAERKQKFKNSIDRLDRDMRENGIAGGIAKWAKDGTKSWVNKQVGRVKKAKDAVKNGAKKAWGTLKSLPGKAWNGIKKGAIATGKAFKKAGISAVELAKKFPGAMKMVGGKIKTGLVKGGKAVGRAAIATKNGIKKAAIATGKGVAKAAVATAKGVKAATIATGKGIKKAAIATGKGVAKAAKATWGTMKKVAKDPSIITKNIKAGFKKAKEGAKVLANKTYGAMKVAGAKLKEGAINLANKTYGAMKVAGAKIKSGFKKAKEGTIKLAKKTYGSMVRLKNKAKEKVKSGIKKGINVAKKGLKKVKNTTKNLLLNTFAGKTYTLIKKGVNKTKNGISYVKGGVNRVRKIGHIIKDSHQMEDRAAAKYAELLKQRQAAQNQQNGNAGNSNNQGSSNNNGGQQ